MASQRGGARIAVFPGQFDPITNGHLDVIERGRRLFDQLIVAVGINPEKRELFSLDERVEMITSLLGQTDGVRVEQYTGLTVDFVRQSQAVAILRGIRDVSDLRYEFQLALANRAVGGVETVFIMTGDQYALTSSSLIRQIVALGGDVNALASLLPPIVVKRLRNRQKKGLNREKPSPDAPSV
jgi:pantetheine-phosphate adenylyltransferase